MWVIWHPHCTDCFSLPLLSLSLSQNVFFLLPLSMQVMTWSFLELLCSYMRLCMNRRGVGCLFFFSFHFLLFLCPKSSKLIYVLSWLSSKRADGTFWKISKSLFSAVNLEVSGQNRASDLCNISSNLLIPQLRKLDQKKFCTCLASYAILVTKQGSRPLGSQPWATWLQCLSIKPNRSQVPCIKTQSSILILCTCYVRAILTFS